MRLKILCFKVLALALPAGLALLAAPVFPPPAAGAADSEMSSSDRRVDEALAENAKITEAIRAEQARIEEEAALLEENPVAARAVRRAAHSYESSMAAQRRGWALVSIGLGLLASGIASVNFFAGGEWSAGTHGLYGLGVGLTAGGGIASALCARAFFLKEGSKGSGKNNKGSS